MRDNKQPAPVCPINDYWADEKRRREGKDKSTLAMMKAMREGRLLLWVSNQTQI